MAKSYADIQAQIEKLQAEAKALRSREVEEVVGRIREAMTHYGLTIADLGLKGKRGKKGSGESRAQHPSSSPKYVDGQGNAWGGRGPRPAWLRDALGQGHALEEFAVDRVATTSSEGATGASRSRSSPRGAKRSLRAKGKARRVAKATTKRQRANAAGTAQSAARSETTAPEAGD